MFLGYYANRALPSSGLFPFMRGLACELNNSCYNVPKEYPDSASVNLTQLQQLTNVATSIFEFTNQNQVIISAKYLAEYFKEILNLRNQAGSISGNLTLSQYLYVSVPTFTKNINTFVNSSNIVKALLSSNPNYNYLYSNYSVVYNEENILLKYILSTEVKNPQQYIDLLYGPDLDVSVNFNIINS